MKNKYNITPEQIQAYKVIGNTCIFEYYIDPKNKFNFIKNPNY